MVWVGGMRQGGVFDSRAQPAAAYRGLTTWGNLSWHKDETLSPITMVACCVRSRGLKYGYPDILGRLSCVRLRGSSVCLCGRGKQHERKYEQDHGDDHTSPPDWLFPLRQRLLTWK